MLQKPHVLVHPPRGENSPESFSLITTKKTRVGWVETICLNHLPKRHPKVSSSIRNDCAANKNLSRMTAENFATIQPTRVFDIKLTFWMVLVVHLCHCKLRAYAVYNFLPATRFKDINARTGAVLLVPGECVLTIIWHSLSRAATANRV